MSFAFVFFAVLALGAAAVVLLTEDITYAAVALLAVFLGLAGFYVLANADFLAVAQILLYVGGILVLLVFGVMLTRREADSSNTIRVGTQTKLLRILAAGGIFWLLTTAIVRGKFTIREAAHFEAITPSTTLDGIGIGLLTTHLIPFEITGILLLIALIGAAYLADKRG